MQSEVGRIGAPTVSPKLATACLVRCAGNGPAANILLAYSLQERSGSDRTNPHTRLSRSVCRRNGIGRPASVNAASRFYTALALMLRSNLISALDSGEP